MKNMKNYSVDNEVRGNAGTASESLHASKAKKLAEEKQNLPRIEEGHKLVRRYSFDDNGGGYLGL